MGLIMNKIFYSWQDDIPDLKHALTRVLERAVDGLADWEIDRAERDPDGADDIAVEIMRKIDESSLVVADVSIVGAYMRPATKKREEPQPRNTANPNVLYEAGYAMKALTKSRVILLASHETTSDTVALPFDLRNRRTMIRDFSKTDDLAAELRAIITKPRPPIAGRGPYIFIEHIGGWSRESNQMTFFFKNESEQNWLLETVSLGGVSRQVQRNLANGDETKLVITGLPIPPFDTQLETIEFAIERGGDRYKVTQKLITSAMAIPKFNLEGVVPSPLIESIDPPQ
jgi:hypothetical protein